MTELRAEYHELNQSQRHENLNDSSATDHFNQRQNHITSRLHCCGVDIWNLSCGSGYCQCSTTTCFAEFGRSAPSNEASVQSVNLSFRKKIIITMLNTLTIAGLLYFLIYYTVYADTNKYRVCVVDGRGGFARAGKYCPILDRLDSKVECVVGFDRMDCLRRIAKGKVDFSVFTAEDLITATNSQIEVLITNELKFTEQKYEYDIVAIVNDDAQINSKYDIRDKKLCHPGYGSETDLTRILANFLEASVVPQTCSESLSLIENRIKASSEYFRSACKAGPWVSNDILDIKLKRKYKNLCALCGFPERCSQHDKYWGRRGALLCLTDGIGDIAWVRLDDAKAHFGNNPNSASASPIGYSYLCPDGSKRPVNSSTPCSWVSKPWPVIATKRTSAQEIQRFINRLDHSDTSSWQHALLNLIESYHVDISSVSPIQAIEGYLINVPGYQSANSFTGCHPPRSIRMCTTSNLENAKCGWMRESAMVYGIEPDFECIKGDNKTHCMQAINDNYADVIVVPPDLIMTAKRDYNLKTLLYEDVLPENRYETVAVVRANSVIKKFEDLKGKKACFPSFEGIAWNSMLYEFHRRGLLSNECPYSTKAANYFGDSCVPGSSKYAPASLTKICNGHSYDGDLGALRCLAVENADVAFVSKSSLSKLMTGQMGSDKWISKLQADHLKIICQEDLKPCELSWSTVGEIMIRSSVSDMALQETFDSFIHVDELFGNNYKTLTRPFSMYGPFDGVHDVLFHDQTARFRDKQYMENMENSITSYDEVLKEVSVCVTASANGLLPTLNTFAVFSIYMFINKVLL